MVDVKKHLCDNNKENLRQKWKMDKNILVSHKEDFSDFLIYLKIRKMEK